MQIVVDDIWRRPFRLERRPGWTKEVAVMQRLSIDSDSLRSIGYNELGQMMEVEFEDGTLRQYYDVPLDIYDDFLETKTKDNYFNDYVKDNYLFQQIH